MERNADCGCRRRDSGSVLPQRTMTDFERNPQMRTTTWTEWLLVLILRIYFPARYRELLVRQQREDEEDAKIAMLELQKPNRKSLSLAEVMKEAQRLKAERESEMQHKTWG